MYQPDVTCGHFWKGSFGGGYKISMFLWEARLLRMIRKTIVGIDFTQTFFMVPKWAYCFISLESTIKSNSFFYFCTLALFMLCIKKVSS